MRKAAAMANHAAKTITWVWAAAWLLTSLTSPSHAEGVRAQNQPAVRAGMVLIANPSLTDPNFAETVVLICQAGPDGTMGLILNRPSEIPLTKALPSIQSPEGESHKVFLGGPVQPQGLLMLFQRTEQPGNTRHVFDRIYWGGNPKMIERMLTQPKADERFRVYAGHAGWAPGQLQAEIVTGAWTTAVADPASVFTENPETLWDDLRTSVVKPRQFISYPFPHNSSNRSFRPQK